MTAYIQTRRSAARAIAGIVATLIASAAPAQQRPVQILDQAAVVSVSDSAVSFEMSRSAVKGLLPQPAVNFSGRRLQSQGAAELAPSSTVLNRIDKSAPAPWFAPIASLLVPGSGQALLKQQRSVAYLVAEGFLALRAVRSNRDRNAAKAWYQKLAADVARQGFGTDKPNGPWDYYEILEHNSSSGAYNLATGGQFTPESDESTYNGKVWLQAREIFWSSPDQPPAESSPEYQRALDRYQKNAVQGSYRFSWKDQTNVQNEYILTIAEANRSTQQVVSTLGLLAASHLASMVDAYVTVRLRKFGGAGLVGASVRTELRPAGAFGDNSYGAAMTFSVPVGNGSRHR